MGVYEKIKAGEYDTKVHYSQENRDAWREDMNRLARKLEEDLAEELEMTNHPKRQMLWTKAWEHGHASGYTEIHYWYTDLLELIK